MFKDEWTMRLKASAGNVPGITCHTVYGHNEDIDATSVPEDLIPAGGTYTFPTAADTISVVSDSAQDAVGGTGGITLCITGLDANWLEIEEIITLTGLTPVVTTKDFLRINSSKITSSGTNEGNVGEILGTHADTSTNVIHLHPDDGISQFAVFSVPALTTWFMTDMLISINRAATTIVCEFDFWTRNEGYGTRYLENQISINSDGGAMFMTPGDTSHAQIIAEKTDFWCRVSYSSANNVDADVQMRGMLIKDSMLVLGENSLYTGP